jgi:hypothetical protein
MTQNACVWSPRPLIKTASQAGFYHSAHDPLPEARDSHGHNVGMEVATTADQLEIETKEEPRRAAPDHAGLAAHLLKAKAVVWSANRANRLSAGSVSLTSKTEPLDS